MVVQDNCCLEKRSCSHAYRYRISWTLPRYNFSIAMGVGNSRPQTDERGFQLSTFKSCRAPHFFHRLKEDMQRGTTQSAILLSVLLAFVFLLGMESSFHERIPGSSSSSMYSFLARSDTPSPIYRQLHHFHSVPRRYLKLMTLEQQRDLLMLMSTPASSGSHATPTRHALFVHISECKLQSCLRAIASAVTYAQVSQRVAVLFIDIADGINVSQLLQLSSNGGLTDDAILVALDDPESDFHGENQTSVVDWAEFTVVHAVAPSSLLELDASTMVSNYTDSRTPVPDYLETLPKIGNTETVATLDNLAALETHVSLTLSEVVWSRYAPRTMQERLFQDSLKPTEGVSHALLSRSSILGRYRATRNIRRTDSLLHQTYDIPEMLLKGMGELERKLLLLKLENKRKRSGVKNPKVIFVHTQYGLGNRLRALGSAMAFARSTGRILVLIWVPDQHLNCRFTDLFVANDEFIVSNSFAPGEEWPFSANAKRDPKMKHVKWYSYMRVNGVKATSSEEPVLDDAKHHIYVSTCYVIQSPVTPFIIRTTSSYWQVLRSLTPHVSVVRLVERFSSYPLSSMIGIHIRGKSIKTDINGVNATDYSEESSRTTDYWRNLTNVDTFIDEMRKQTADQMFYVAADQKEVFARLEHEFPSRVVYTPRHCDSRDRDCLPFALADILLLAKCASLRGSYWSSFSELSTRIGGARFLLAGIDFGRP